ncbi:MAG: DUF2125 domain-containing protein [Parvularculaceae bacterium]
MKRANRWLLYGPLLVAALILAGWRVAWGNGADAMRRALADFSATEAARGVSVSFSPLRARGFPFYLRGAVDAFSVSAGDDAYDCARLYLDALPYQPDRVIFSCGGDQRAALGGEVWTITAPDARASLENDRDRGWIVRAETGAFAAAAGGRELVIESLMINIAPDKEESGAIDVSFRAVEAAPPAAAKIDIARIDAALRIFPTDAFNRRRVDVLGLEAVVNDGVLSASGSLGIDSAGVTGQLDAGVEKPVGIVRAIAAAGLLDENDAQAAQAGLAMLAVASGGRIAAPIEFQGNEVRLAGVSLGRIGDPAQP